MTTKSATAGKSTLDPADREFLDQLHKLGASTVQAICDAMEVTPTAVRQRLGRLMSSGLATRKRVHASRGRPFYQYSVTNAGLQQLGDNYGELALVLWRELSRIGDQRVREAIVEGLRNTFVERYSAGVNADVPLDRLRQLRQALADRGFDVEIDVDRELPVLRENNCPYLELASGDSSICELEQTVFQEILGAEVRLSQCCLDGHRCCEFELVSIGAGSSKP